MLMYEQHKIMADNVEVAEQNAEKYLLFANAGAILSVSAIYSKTHLISSTFWVALAVFLFFIGIVCVGILHLIRINYIYNVKVSWEKDYQEYTRKKMSSNEFNTRHYFRLRLNRNRLGKMALLAFGIYIFSVVLIGINMAANIFYYPQQEQIVNKDPVNIKEQNEICSSKSITLDNDHSRQSELLRPGRTSEKINKEAGLDKKIGLTKKEGEIL